MEQHQHEHTTTTTETKISCTKCSYDLAGLDLTGSCPECGTKIITNCYQCNYILEGLDPTGNCPECGYLIADSVGRGILSRCSPTYIARLHKGVVLIETAIILMVIQVITAGILGALATTLGGFSARFVQAIILSVSLVLSFIFLIGWYLFSSPNELVGSTYSGGKARKFVRVVVVLTAAIKLIQVPLVFTTNRFLLDYVAGSLSILAGVIFIFRFYSELMYVRWMAPLLRNTRVYKRTTTLMWMGPILFILMAAFVMLTVYIMPTIGIGGVILIGIGALAMLIMYWNMLDWIRKDLKAIRAAH